MMDGTTAIGWRSALAALALCLGWIVFWYWDTAAAMVTIWWRSETFAHAFLVPPIALWLAWRKRVELAATVPRPDLKLVWLILLAGGAWLLGELAAVNSVMHLSLIALLVAATVVVVGRGIAWLLLFPLGYLFFAAPVGEFVVPQFMDWTANFTVAALRLSGIPVYREGLHFVIPSGRWSVVTACSGVRYLIASVVVGTLYAYLTYRSTRKQLIFVGLSILVPIVANWVRAYLIVMLGHLSNNELAVGVDHLIYGWIFFGVVVIMMYWIGNRWADPPESGLVTVDEKSDKADQEGVKERSRWFPPLLVIAIVSALPPILVQGLDRIGLNQSTPILTLDTPTGWQREPIPEVDWRPTFSDPSAELRGEFRKGDRRIGLFIAYYTNQDDERKLISSLNVLVRPSDDNWHPIGRGEVSRNIGGQDIVVQTTLLQGRKDRQLVAWYWYWVDGHLTSNPYVAKVRTAVSRLLGHGDDSAVVVLFALQDSGDADAALGEFSDAAGASLGAALRDARIRGE